MCLCPSAVPEFRALVGNEAVEELQCSVGDAVQTSQVLKKCFTRMMNCEKKVFVDQLNMLVKRVSEEGEQHSAGRDTHSVKPGLCVHTHLRCNTAPDWPKSVCLQKVLHLTQTGSFCHTMERISK